MEYKSDVEAVDALVEIYSNLKNEIAKVIVGQEEVVQQVLISIFCNGHCLLVGVPGMAKTLLVQTIADSLGLNFTYMIASIMAFLAIPCAMSLNFIIKKVNT